MWCSDKKKYKLVASRNFLKRKGTKWKPNQVAQVREGDLECNFFKVVALRSNFLKMKGTKWQPNQVAQGREGDLKYLTKMPKEKRIKWWP